VSFVDSPDDPEAWRAAVRPNTKAFFAETISNPQIDVLDIETVAGVAHEAGVPLIVDNTVATPYLIRPLEWGADVVVHSATKYLGGHGTAIAGVIVDGGTFDFAADPERFPGFNTPDPSYNGLVYARDLGVGSAMGANLAFVLKARVQLLRDLGPATTPFNAFLLAQGSRPSACGWSATSRTPARSRSGCRAATRSRASPTPGCPTSRWHAARRSTPPRGARAPCSPSRSRAVPRRAAVRRGARAAQPRGEHR
jgi:O-acetylhomoserine (thiol)-lyase